MFCPRCGRPVSDTANFCGGCGLPKSEIIKMTQVAVPQPQPETIVPEIDVTDINNTISQLEGDLTGINPVEDYTTDTQANTNKVENEFSTTENSVQEKPADTIYNEIHSSTMNSAQSDYSLNAPKYPYYSQPEQTAATAEPVKTTDDEKLTTVDFIWMLLISGIPVIGFIYLLYTAFVQTNDTKRAWAKATLIITVFAFVLSMVFSMGIMMTSFMYW